MAQGFQRRLVLSRGFYPLTQIIQQFVSDTFFYLQSDHDVDRFYDELF